MRLSLSRSSRLPDMEKICTCVALSPLSTHHQNRFRLSAFHGDSDNVKKNVSLRSSQKLRRSFFGEPNFNFEPIDRWAEPSTRIARADHTITP